MNLVFRICDIFYLYFQLVHKSTKSNKYPEISAHICTSQVPSTSSPSSCSNTSSPPSTLTSDTPSHQNTFLCWMNTQDTCYSQSRSSLPHTPHICPPSPRTSPPAPASRPSHTAPSSPRAGRCLREPRGQPSSTRPGQKICWKVWLRMAGGWPACRCRWSGWWSGRRMRRTLL